VAKNKALLKVQVLSVVQSDAAGIFKTKHHETINIIYYLSSRIIQLQTKTARTKNNNQNNNHLPRHMRF
jgi:hypothetical protein